MAPRHYQCGQRGHVSIVSGGLGGTIRNDGAINLNYDAGAGASGNLNLDSYSGTFTLSGTGSLTMADQAQAGSLTGTTQSETLINGASHTIFAAGSMTGISLVNNGTLNVTGVNAGFQISNSDLINNGSVVVNGLGMSYTADSSRTFDNQGVIAVQSGSSLTLANSADSPDVHIHNDGNINLTNAIMC